MALKRGFRVTTDELKLMDPDDRVQAAFAPGTVDRCKAWREKDKRTKGFIISDIEHWPGRGPGGCQEFPCLLTHGTVLRMDQSGEWQLALGKDH
eukprot:3700001-Pyramimonas_sp.AAC.1